MKRIIVALLALMLAFALCACGSKPKPEPEPDPVPVPEPDDPIIEMTLPRAIAGDVNEENLSGFLEYYGYESAVINPDGSVTVSLTTSKWMTTIALIRMQIDDELGKLPGSPSYPAIRSATVNGAYDEFTIRTANAEPDEKELWLCQGLAGYAYYHAVYSGTEPFRFTVRFLSDDTGEVIYEFTEQDWTIPE